MARAAITIAALGLGAGLVLFVLNAPTGERLPSAAKQAAPLPPVRHGLSLRAIVQAAGAEGEVRVGWNRTLSDDWRQRFETAYNREFGLSLTLKSAGDQPPDVIVGSEAQYAGLYRQGQLGTAAWPALFGAPAPAVLYDNGAVAFAHEIIRPAFRNGAGVPACQEPSRPSGPLASGDACPTSWDALLDPRLKGRIGVADSTDVWVALSTVWGDDKTARFLHGLAAQQPLHGTPAELEQRLAQGAIDAIAATPDRLPPDAQVANVEPAILSSLAAGPLKSAVHPNAGLLFAGFLLTQEGQQLWQDYSGQSSIYVDGSAAQRFVQAHRYLLLSDTAANKDLAVRAVKYANILGY